MRYLFSFIILFACLSFCQAQNEMLVVKDIEVIGNKKTKTNIVLRELDFRIGDTISFELLSDIIKQNERLLINTNLFNKADFVATYPTDDEISFTITVIEDWYIFPLIGVDLADRNFNVWWVEQNHALNRLDVGLHLIHNNFTGRKDYARLVTEFGYTQRLQFEYRRPYINEAQTIGFMETLTLVEIEKLVIKLLMIRCVLSDWKMNLRCSEVLAKSPFNIVLHFGPNIH